MRVLTIVCIVACLGIIGCLEGPTGPQGEKGNPAYVHIKYSPDGGNTFTDNNGEVFFELDDPHNADLFYQE